MTQLGTEYVLEQKALRALRRLCCVESESGCFPDMFAYCQ